MTADKIYTTLKAIRSKRPCGLERGSNEGYDKLRKTLGKDYGDDTPVTFRQIYESNGYLDTLWCMRCVDPVWDSVIRHFAVDCAEDVRHLMTDQRSLDALVVARRYADGLATEEELEAARAAAWAAARAAAQTAAGRRKDRRTDRRRGPPQGPPPKPPHRQTAARAAAGPPQTAARAAARPPHGPPQGRRMGRRTDRRKGRRRGEAYGAPVRLLRKRSEAMNKTIKILLEFNDASRISGGTILADADGSVQRGKRNGRTGRERVGPLEKHRQWCAENKRHIKSNGGDGRI